MEVRRRAQVGIGGAYLPVLTASLSCLLTAAPCWGQVLPTVKLKAEAVRAFQKYVEFQEAIHDQRMNDNRPFLWIDDSPSHRSLVEKGEIVIQDNSGQGVGVPGGIVQDWIGAMLIPGGSLRKTLQLLRDYDRHQDIYPEVVDSRLLSSKDDTLRAYLRLAKTRVLTVVLNTEHEVQFREISHKRGFIRSRSTRITEVKNAGKPDETQMPVGEDSGFLWRLNAYWRLEETDQGLYVELSTVSLSRDMPTGLAWLIKPFIREFPKESLQSTLAATRQAIQP